MVTPRVSVSLVFCSPFPPPSKHFLFPRSRLNGFIFARIFPLTTSMTSGPFSITCCSRHTSTSGSWPGTWNSPGVAAALPPSEFPRPLPGRPPDTSLPIPGAERTALFLACLFDTVLLSYLSRKPGVCFCFVHGPRKNKLIMYLFIIAVKHRLSWTGRAESGGRCTFPEVCLGWSERAVTRTRLRLAHYLLQVGGGHPPSGRQQTAGAERSALRGPRSGFFKHRLTERFRTLPIPFSGRFCPFLVIWRLKIKTNKTALIQVISPG